MLWSLRSPDGRVLAAILAGIGAFSCAGEMRIPDTGMPPLDVRTTAAAGDVGSDIRVPPVAFRGLPLRSADIGLRSVDAIGYEVELALDDPTEAAETFRATTVVTLLALEPISSVDLDFEGNEIDSVDVDGLPAESARNGNVLTVTLPGMTVARQPLAIRVRYHAPFLQARPAGGFNTNGGLMVRQRTRTGRRMYFSMDWPTRTRRWIPVRDHPRDGAMFAIRATFPAEMTVLANGHRVGTTDAPDAMRTWEYEALTPMPVYDFHVAAYDDWTDTAAPAAASGVAIHHFDYTVDVTRNARAFVGIQTAMDFFETTFGRFRWGQLSYLEEPQIGGGMEHASVVSLDENVFPLADARLIAVHEMAHHWSGNLARIGTWNDLWMSEGFADYLTRRFIEQADGPAAGAALWRNTLALGLAAEARLAMPHALRPPDPEVDVLTIFDNVIYKKGAFVLHMLERNIGTERFTAFLRGWFDRHEYSSVTSRMLQAELQTMLGVDVARFFTQWVDQPGYPVLNVRWNWDSMASTVEVVVDQVQAARAADGFQFDLEVRFDTAMGAQTRTIALTGRSTTMRFPLPAQPTAALVDPNESMFGVVRCDMANPCRTGYSCGVLGGGPGTVCIPPAT